MGKSSGSNRTGGDDGGFPKGDSAFRGEIKNARDLATIRDGAVYKEMKEGISRYHAVMGVRQRSVKIADLPERINGVHVTSGTGESEGVYLNSRVFDRLSRNQIRERVTKAYDSGWSTRTNKPIQHTITHELAHATWNSHLKSASAIAAGKEIRALRSEWLRDGKKKGYGEYATSNVNEFWAEVTAKAVHGTPDRYTRAAKAIVKKYKL